MSVRRRTRDGRTAKMAIKLALVVGAILVLAFTALTATLYQQVLTPALLLLIAFLASFCLGVLWIRSAQQLKLLGSIRSEIAANHKRASVWDWKLNDRLNKSGVARADGPTQVYGTLGGAEHPQARALLDTGAFQESFYAAAAQSEFGDEVEAASHYLSTGMLALVGPNAIVDPQCFPDSVRQAMRTGDAETLIAHLSSRSDHFGPAFDAARVSTNPGSAMGPLGCFLGSMTDRTLLPVSTASPLHGIRASRYISLVTGVRARLAADQLLKVVRTTRTWDAQAESQWKEGLPSDFPHPPPMVSIIMPVRNRADSVKHAIASVIGQTYHAWELLVVDDHSTDATMEVVEQLARPDARIHVLRNPRKGVSSARNTGLQAATGQYVAFLDSDNEWRADFLGCMVKAAERDAAAWSYAASRLVYSADRILFMAFEGTREHLLIKNHIDMNVMMIRRELALQVKGFDEGLRRWVDHDFALRLSRLATPTLRPFIGCDYEHSMERPDRITVRESPHWQWAVFAKALLDWDSYSRDLNESTRLSVIISSFGEPASTLRAVESILRASLVDAPEVIVVDNGSEDVDAFSLAQQLCGRPHVRLLRLPKNYNVAIGNNFGFLASRGEFVLFLSPRVELRTGAIDQLLDQMKDPSIAGAQPLLLNPDDTVLSAGTAWAPAAPLPFQLLFSHPSDDAEPLADYAFSAASGAALLMRSSDFHRLQGFDPLFINGLEDLDLCLRALRIRPSGFRVVTETRFTVHDPETHGQPELGTDRQLFLTRWRHQLPGDDSGALARCGFSLARVSADGSNASIQGTSVILTRRPDAPRRWAIKNPATADRRGDGWGDTHFADSLAQSLRRAGQEVVTYRHQGHGSPATSFDDVSLTLRGKHRGRIMPGQVNIMWIISHPDSITAEELGSFDLVYAASTQWAAWATSEFGVVVKPLLQATDASRFSYSDPPSHPSTDLVFVGGNHAGRDRRGVSTALRSGVKVTIYGPGWENVADEHIAGTYVPNVNLGAVYRDAHFVLADHWADMAQEGFIQNRVFDAVASGCRVLTDPVSGLYDVFGDEVISYSNEADVKAAVVEAVQSRHLWSNEARRAASDRILAQHSFDARAAALMNDLDTL